MNSFLKIVAWTSASLGSLSSSEEPSVAGCSGSVVLSMGVLSGSCSSGDTGVWSSGSVEFGVGDGASSGEGSGVGWVSFVALLGVAGSGSVSGSDGVGVGSGVGYGCG